MGFPLSIICSAFSHARKPAAVKWLIYLQIWYWIYFRIYISIIDNYYYSNNNSSLTQLCVTVWKQHLIPVWNDAPPVEIQISLQQTRSTPRHATRNPSTVNYKQFPCPGWSEDRPKRGREREEGKVAVGLKQTHIALFTNCPLFSFAMVTRHRRWLARCFQSETARGGCGDSLSVRNCLLGGLNFKHKRRFSNAQSTTNTRLFSC